MRIGTFILWFCKLEADKLSLSYFLETMLNFDVYCTGSYNWFTFKFDFAIILGFIYGFSTINDLFISLFLPNNLGEIIYWFWTFRGYYFFWGDIPIVNGYFILFAVDLEIGFISALTSSFSYLS